MSDPPSSSPSGAARITGTSPDDLDHAARLLLSGGLVAMPTETVYGLAADATNGCAVAAIYTAKGRPAFNPLICHVASIEMAEACAELSPLARSLIARFWPGPLTLVLPRRPDCPVNELATAGLETIGLRMPKHPAAIELIARVGRPLAAPSANMSERLSPTTAQHVADEMGDRIDLVLDGGACAAGIESTIVALSESGSQSGAVLLRAGAAARADIEMLTGSLRFPRADSGVLAPGMMRRHYAPDARLRLDATDAREGEAFLAFGPPPHGVSAASNLSASGDLAEAASNLFAMLRALDSKFEAISIAPIPDRGLGEGIRDRLERAAAKKNLDGV